MRYEAFCAIGQLLVSPFAHLHIHSFLLLFFSICGLIHRQKSAP